MMIRKTLFGALLALSLSGAASATPLHYTQTFDGSTNGWQYSISFIADDTTPSVVTAFSGTLNGDPLTLLPPGTFVNNDNVFDPSLLSVPGSRGWHELFIGGLVFQNTVNGDNFLLVADMLAGAPYIPNSTNFPNDYAINFQTSSQPLTTVDEPGMFALLAIGGAGLGFRRRKAAA